MMPHSGPNACAQKAEPRPPPAFPHLPEEIWLHISSLLSTREWAGASGACRALHQVQPVRIDIVTTCAELDSSALEWLMRRLGSAKSIALDTWPLTDGARVDCLQRVALALKLHLSQKVLPCLAVLKAKMDQNMSKDGEVHYREPRELRSILKQAINLSMLDLVCNKMPLLPDMASLRHLALSVKSFHMDSERLSPMLQAMPCLQTLQLKQSELEQCHSHTWGDGTLVVPASVERLELGHFFPESLELLSGGTMVRMSGVLCCMRQAFLRWPDVRDQIKGLRLFESPSERDWGFTEINLDLWGSVEVLRFVSWQGSDLHGLADVNLSKLATLHITGHNACVCIPASSSLKDVRIECLDMLCIEFEDAALTARHVVHFEATFRTTCRAGSLIGFCNTMQRAGKEAVVKFYDYTNVGAQNVYFLHYEEPEVIEGWARLISGCGCEGCVSDLGRFSGTIAATNNVTGSPDSVAADLGHLEEMLGTQVASCCYCPSCCR